MRPYFGLLRGVCLLMRKHRRVLCCGCSMLLLTVVLYGLLVPPSSITSQVFTASPVLAQPCTEQQDVVYLKVHKSASSTIANILQRFGYSRQLNFALPNKTQGKIRYNYFGELGETLNATGMKSSQKDARTFNILYNHVVFNKDAFEAIFPHSRATYITMLRDPETQFKSALLFFRHSKIFSAAKENLTVYLEHPEVYEPENAFVSFTDNRQSLDLGLPVEQVRRGSFIRWYIKLLDASFDLVMIMEYFNESLILLKRRMCWSFKDILYIQKNKAYQKFDFHLGVHEKYLLRQWLKADTMIYEHFHDKFISLLKEDPSISEETLWFQTVVQQTQAFCKGHANVSHTHIKGSRWNTGFYVTSLDCMYMKIGELDFLNKLLHDGR